MKKLKVLVTGSSGTIGSALCTRLIDRGHSVVGIDAQKQKWDNRIETIVCDLRQTFPKLNFNPDVLVHLAANPFVRASVSNPELATDNSKMTENVIAYWVANKIEHFVFGSSREVYGNQNLVSFSEDNVTGSTESPYAASKLSSELKIRKASSDYGLSHTIVRFSNVYGRFDGYRNDGHTRVIPLFIKQCKLNKPLAVFGKDKKFDFTYIDDAVEGVVLSVEKQPKNETINLATGVATPLYKVAEMIIAELHSKSTITFEDVKKGEVSHYAADIAKAKKLLGYSPKVSLAEGIKLTVKWYNSHTEVLG